MELGSNLDDLNKLAKVWWFEDCDETPPSITLGPELGPDSFQLIVRDTGSGLYDLTWPSDPYSTVTHPPFTAGANEVMVTVSRKPGAPSYGISLYATDRTGTTTPEFNKWIDKLVVNTNQVIQDNFLGVNAVYHGFAFMDEQEQKGMTDADRTREFGRVISMGLNIARTWYRPDYTCGETWASCLDSSQWITTENRRLDDLYKWLDVMKANNIDVALQVGWWTQDVQEGDWDSFKSFNADSYTLGITGYAKWVTRSITEIVVTNHYTNVKYLMMLTEPTQLSGKPNSEYADVNFWPGYKQAVMAVHEQLVANGLHVDRVLTHSRRIK